MTNIDLLNCPFCGSHANLTKSKANASGTRMVYQVKCSDEKFNCPCSPMTKWFDSENEAVRAWNVRIISDSIWNAVIEESKQMEKYLTNPPVPADKPCGGADNAED